MMKIKRQNKLRTYLAVTAGVGCAGSVSNAAVVAIDISDFSGPNGGVDSGFARSGLAVDVGGVTGEFSIFNGSNNTYGLAGSSTLLFGFDEITPVFPSTFPRLVGYGVPLSGNGQYSQNAADSAFRFEGNSQAIADDGLILFLPFILPFGEDEVLVGFFQVATDGPEMFEILGGAVESVAGNPITTFDTTAVPEPSSLALLALGATGLAARRKRKMAA